MSTDPPVRRIGLFGGTFDPIHNGHIAVAKAVRDALKLDMVLMAPAPRPWLRTNAPTAGDLDRLDMVKAAVEGEEGLEASDVDMRRPGPTYSVDTIADLQREHGDGNTFFLIVGADAANGMDRWREAHRLRELGTIVVVGRPGNSSPADLPEDHPAHGAVLIEGPMLEISSTEIRRRLADGEHVTDMLPEGVERIIRERRLYPAGAKEKT